MADAHELAFSFPPQSHRLFPYSNGYDKEEQKKKRFHLSLQSLQLSWLVLTLYFVSVICIH